MLLVLSSGRAECAVLLSRLVRATRIRCSVAGSPIFCVSGETPEGIPAAAAVTGIGKLNALLCVRRLSEILNPSAVLFTGTAGAVSPELQISDFVISRTILQYDTAFWNQALGWSRMPGPVFPENRAAADAILTDALLRAATGKERVFSGTTATADVLMNPEILPLYTSLFSDASVLSVDMEGFAAAAAAADARVPFAQVRVISDEADGKRAPRGSGFMGEVSRKLAAVVFSAAQTLR